jgi:hypothetical protein
LFEQRKRQEEAEKWKIMDQEIAAYAKKRAARELEYKKEQDAKKAEKTRVKDQMIARMEAVNPSYHKTLERFYSPMQPNSDGPKNECWCYPLGLFVAADYWWQSSDGKD